MGRHADGLALAIPIPARPELDEVAMPRRNGEVWSDKDISTLRRMFRAATRTATLRTLERTEASVSSRISDLKRRRLLGPDKGDAK